ncbi:MAG: permease, partial [Methylophilus sp.]
MKRIFSFLLGFPSKQPLLFLLVAASIWLGLYQILLPMSDWMVHALPVVRESRFGSALQFFFYDTPK